MFGKAKHQEELCELGSILVVFSRQLSSDSLYFELDLSSGFPAF